MSRSIELIDKYIVKQEDSGAPDYIWTDNTGELIRCADCINWITYTVEPTCIAGTMLAPAPDDYCSRAERR